MEKFDKKRISKSQVPPLDNGIKVSELVKLIKNNSLAEQLLPLLKIEDIKDEYVNIKGAKTIVNAQQELNNRFQKEDFQSELKDISLYSENEFTINFNKIDKGYFDDLKLKQVATIPIYSATKDFFSEMFQMDRYASRLIKEKHNYILEENFRMLKDIHSFSKKYRILHDKKDDLFYLRAIISTSSYHNYDNNIAIVVGLLTLHNDSKETGTEYSLLHCEYNESFIRMVFESSEIKKLSSIGTVRNSIEISNDEIKREALKFSGSCSIVYEENDKRTEELFISPNDIKSKILSVRHNNIPETAILELANIDNAKNVFEELFDDISKIAKIKNPDQIKFLVRSKIDNATNDNIKQHKSKLIKELDKSVTNIVQLLSIFKKLEILAGEDIEAVEFLRYIIYEALVKPK